MHIIAVGVKALAAFFMRKTRIFYKGEEYTLLSHIGIQPLQNEGRVICIAPTLCEHSDLDIIDIGTQKTEPRVALKILEIYLTCVCMYPLAELVINLGGTRFTLRLSDSKRFRNTVIFSNMVELRLETVITDEYKARVYRCRDSELCFRDLLHRMLVVDGLVNCDTALIVGV